MTVENGNLRIQAEHYKKREPTERQVRSELQNNSGSGNQITGELSIAVSNEWQEWEPDRREQKKWMEVIKSSLSKNLAADKKKDDGIKVKVSFCLFLKITNI